MACGAVRVEYDGRRIWHRGRQCAEKARSDSQSRCAGEGGQEFASGEFAGRTLGEVWPSLPEEWTGTSLRGLPRIPLLVKFIFPEEKLSVQVHPDDNYAEQYESAAGGVGKTM